MIDKIKDKLKKIEEQEKIKILFAVESGSRAWGFASKDSDYDVRFVYRRSLDDYLKLEQTKDVIEWELNDIYDINGWDLKKTLNLIYRSNTTIYEWLNSPIVYLETTFLKELKELATPYYQVVKAANHYLNIARKDYQIYCAGAEINLKKYFYVLRSLLAAQYVLEKKQVPPIVFDELMASGLPISCKAEVERLLAIKQNGGEILRCPRSAKLDEYIESKLESLAKTLSGLKLEHRSIEPLDELFINTIMKPTLD